MNKKQQKLVNEALKILEELELPKPQQNERSALSLLALLNLTPSKTWKDAEGPMVGIRAILDFCRNNYGKPYAENTRETFRRQTMHQFVAAGIAMENPDNPHRPINSPKWCYQIEPAALRLLREHFRKPSWKQELKGFLAESESLAKKYAMEREMLMIPVAVALGKSIQLTPGKHSQLIKEIIEGFAPRFAPGGVILYAGDTGEKWGYFDEAALDALGVKVDMHGKMPDVVIYYPAKNWILLIEAVTSHGPVNAKRREELAKLFSPCTAGAVYVTAFPTRADMTRYLTDISWETEVWIAEAPSHLIHFNGARFLGPYE
jgi:BsuBI/PstI restriction endonuclease domain/BsuBI/PstI restriction endonuclease HTH domain